MMKTRIALLTLCLPLVAAAQSSTPPADPGMTKPPADSGAVVQPPQVNDKSIATPPKNVDPKIDSATDDIDQANKKKSDDKKKKKGVRRKENAPTSKP